MNEWIELADGTRIFNAYVVKLSEIRIAIYSAWHGTFAEAAEIFCDPKKTAVIKSDQYGDEATWEGYTRPDAIQIFETDVLSVALNKEVNPDV